jgi:hypothetical protein
MIFIVLVKITRNFWNLERTTKDDSMSSDESANEKGDSKKKIEKVSMVLRYPMFDGSLELLRTPFILMRTCFKMDF